MRKITWLIFGFCLIYWIYLIFQTKMPVLNDSLDYEYMGRTIYQNGWLEFFRTGPHRGPFYPAVIALSMALSKTFLIDYQLILKFFQVTFLFFTQVLLFITLRKLNVREWTTHMAVLYFGISPATINAALSEYSEIVVFPFVVAAVLLAASLWRDLCFKKSYKVILLKSILFGSCFWILALGQGVFQYIFYVFIIPFCIFAVFGFYRRDKKALLSSLAAVLAAFTFFYSAVSYIKSMNFRYNGQRVLCNTHLDILLGSAYKRSQPISSRIIAAHIASIPGNGVCKLFFSQQECDYADWYGSESFRVGQAIPTIEAMPKEHRELRVFRLTAQKAIDHPFQYIFFSTVEVFKMPFWESTQIGFVEYPKRLAKFYSYPLIRFGLRLLMGTMTIVAFAFVSLGLWRKKHLLFSAEVDKSNTIWLFFVWLTIASYTFFYSLCYVITRYALPIASLYIVCIALAINSILAKPKK